MVWSMDQYSLTNADQKCLSLNRPVCLLLRHQDQNITQELIDQLILVTINISSNPVIRTMNNCTQKHELSLLPEITVTIQHSSHVGSCLKNLIKSVY